MTTKAQAIKMVETLAAFNPKADAEQMAHAMCELDERLHELNHREDGRRVYTWWPGRTCLVCDDGEIAIDRGQHNSRATKYDEVRDLGWYTKAFEL